MYFNVNFNVFFKLIKVHFLVSELYIYQNARYNEKESSLWCCLPKDTSVSAARHGCGPEIIPRLELCRILPDQQNVMPHFARLYNNTSHVRPAMSWRRNLSRNIFVILHLGFQLS